jgi:hypothetical protein
MKLKYLIFLSIILMLPKFTNAQGSFWGIKSGGTVATQAWAGFQAKDPLIAYHANVFYEELGREGNGGFVMQAGYHLRGSSIITRSFSSQTSSGQAVTIPSNTQKFIFKNISVLMGIKKYFNTSSVRAFYGFGLRGEYTIGTNLASYENTTFGFYFPQNSNVNKFNYGFNISGGIDFAIDSKKIFFVEFGVSPDISRQYFRQAFNAYDPFGKTFYLTQQESIKNLTLEISLGVKFLRKVIETEDDYSR